jgi:hypothetical protein
MALIMILQQQLQHSNCSGAAPAGLPGAARSHQVICLLYPGLLLQRLSGDLFLFMDTCSSLLSVLRL